MYTLEHPPRIYLARHCKTQWNLEKRLVGTSDIPLCKEGRDEAYANLPMIEFGRTGSLAVH
jgi:broad specificity phosphatase PhoE